jgi:glycosyltransferase involved in cell wall biosynthesis
VPPPPGVRVVLDVRPLQTPDRAPLAAAYLEELLAAYDKAPIGGESFALFLRSDLPDPTTQFAALDIVGRRLVPPTRLLGAAGMTVDPFVLRGASIGVAWRAEDSGAAGAVYHAVGGSPLPIAPSLPVVVTLLDLAPWEMPQTFQASIAGRFGHRLRAQQVHEAAAVIVGTQAVARAARRLLHVRRERVHIVPIPPRAAFAARPTKRSEKAATALLEKMGIDGRFLVFAGRYDARLDHGSMLGALASLARRPRPSALDPEVPWPPRVLLTGASPDDRASIARTASRHGVSEWLTYAPALSTEALAGVVRAARAAILPVLSESAGLPVIEALTAGTPVVASATGALPELVGQAGLLVDPGDPERLATALAAIWADDTVHGRVTEAAAVRAKASRHTWADVARETRGIYAEVGVRSAGR